MEEEKQNYTREQLIVTLFDLYRFSSSYMHDIARARRDAELNVFLRHRKEQRKPSLFVSFEEEEQRKQLEIEREYYNILCVIQRKVEGYSRILDVKYWKPNTVLDISLYLELGQAQTVEQAVELYEKGEKYQFFNKKK